MNKVPAWWLLGRQRYRRIVIQGQPGEKHKTIWKKHKTLKAKELGEWVKQYSTCLASTRL
jgi:hypothetical protein